MNVENDVLVIVLNAFTGRIAEGYIADRQTMRKMNASLRSAQVGELIANNPEIRIKFLTA